MRQLLGGKIVRELRCWLYPYLSALVPKPWYGFDIARRRKGLVKPTHHKVT